MAGLAGDLGESPGPGALNSAQGEQRPFLRTRPSVSLLPGPHGQWLGGGA